MRFVDMWLVSPSIPTLRRLGKVETPLIAVEFELSRRVIAPDSNHGARQKAQVIDRQCARSGFAQTQNDGIVPW
jgi:hypothetical protein